MPSNDYHRYVSKDQRNRRIKRIILEILISVVLITSAIIFSIYRKEIIDKSLSSKVILAPGSAGFKTWLDPPITTTRSYHLFNITNPIEIVTDPKSATIKFTDTSPYTYNVKTSKTNVEWLDNNTKISYAVERLFTRDSKRFNPSSVNDKGCFVNLLRAIFRTQFGSKTTDAFYAIGGNNVFYHRNAVEQLEGFTSDLFYAMQDKMTGPNIAKSGFVYRYNGSRLYNISIKTNLTEKGQVLAFANQVVPHSFNTSESVYGFPIYDGLTYPPMLFDKPALHIFNSDFCKPVLIEFNRIVPIFKGMNLHEYKLKLIDYDSCTNPNDTSTCKEVDKLDISKCMSDSLPENTIFLSKAHFYGSNETVQDMNIEGFTPTSDKHDSFVYFEPYTGTPFKAVLRIQINIDATIDPMEQVREDGTDKLEPLRGKKGVKRLIPVFWLDQEVKISDRIRITMMIAFFLSQHGPYVVIPLAILLAIIIIVIIEIIAKRSAKKARYSRGAYHKTGTTGQY